MIDFSPNQDDDKDATLVCRDVQYLYRSSESYFTCMDLSNFDEIELSFAEIGKQALFLKEGLEGIRLTLFAGAVVGVDLPPVVELEVFSLAPLSENDTESLSAALETGGVITVPAHVRRGDIVLVSPATGKYLGLRKIDANPEQ